MSFSSLNVLDPHQHRLAPLRAVEEGEGPLRDDERAQVAAALEALLGGGGDAEAAVTLLRRVFALHERRDGLAHPDTTAVAAALVGLHLQVDEAGPALALCDRLLAAPEVASEARLQLMHSRAQALADEEDAQPRREALGALIAAARELEGADSSWALIGECNLGELDYSVGDMASARDRWAAATAGYTRLYGEDHDETLEVRTNLAVARKLLGEWADALAEEEAIYALRLARLGAESPLTLGAGHNLATTLLHLGQLERGEALAEEVFAGKLEHMGPQDQETAMTGRTLAEHYESTGRPELAEALRTRHRAAMRAFLEQLGIDPSMLGGEE
jgi:hypothetical protein